jgi:protein O-mannosyl-transferase
MPKKIQILLFIAAGFVCYYSILGSSFLSEDFWLIQYNDSLPTLLQNNFYDHYLLTFTHLVNFVLFRIFGYYVPAYHVFSLMLHIINAWLVVVLLQKIYSVYNISTGNKSLFFMAGLLFLVLPYQTEAVVWYSAKSYLLATFFLLIAFISWLGFKENGKTRSIVISMTAFVLSLFSKEIAIIFPLIIIAFEATISQKNRKKSPVWVLVFLMIPALYFMARYLILGSFIGGYDARIHLNFHAGMILFHYLMYFLKFFALFRYLPLHNIFVYVSILLAGIGLTIILIRKLKNDKPQQHEKWYLLIFLFSTFVITLLPVINLEITSLSQVQSDRYGYLSSIPTVLIMAIIIDIVAGLTWFKNMVYIVVFITFAFFTLKTNQLWQYTGLKSEKILNSVVKNVQESNRDIYFLNVPDNYRGIYLFRNGLKDAIRQKSSHERSLAVHILSYQLNNTSQTILLRKTNANVYSLTLQKGDTFINTDDSAFADQSFIKIVSMDNTCISFTTSITDTVHPDKLFLYYNNDIMLPVR